MKSMGNANPEVDAWLRKIYLRIFHSVQYETELELAIGDAATVLDVGCGYPSPIRTFSRNFHSVGVDAFEPSIEMSRAEGIHDEYVKSDVLEIGERLGGRAFDCVVASDLIEHLDKEDGKKLLGMMERIARKRVVVFTPNGFVRQGKLGGNPWQLHRSGWTPAEMAAMGYKTVGINGLKFLRGEFALPKYRPMLLWRLISDITQIFLKKFPSLTFSILCVKEMNAANGDAQE